METFSELIELSEHIINPKDIVRIGEIDSLRESKGKLRKIEKLLSPLQMELLLHDMSFPIFGYFFDNEKGTINNFGQEFIDISKILSPDLFLLTSFYSRVQKPPTSMRTLSSEFLTPYSLFRFLKELGNSVSSLMFNMQTEREILSKLIIKCALSAKELLEIKDYDVLYNTVLEYLHAISSENIDTLVIIVQTSLYNASANPLLLVKGSNMVENVRTTLLNSAKVSGQVFDSNKKKFSLLKNFISLNTYIHQRLTSMKKYWICDINQNREMVSNAREQLILLSQKVGFLLGKKNPRGSLSLTLTVNWEPEFAKSRLSQSSYFEITYENCKVLLQLEANTAEIVLPIFDNAPVVDVRLLYIVEKFDGVNIAEATKEAIGILKEYQISNITKNSELVEKFKRRNSAMSSKCGSVITTIRLSSASEAVDQMRSDLSHGDINIYQVLDMLTTKIIRKWMQKSRIMNIYPPEGLFLGLFEICLRHGIPSSIVFIMLLTKLFDGWCSAESYLSAFCGLLMITHTATQQSPVPQSFLDSYNNLLHDLKQKVTTLLFQQLSRPGAYEKLGLCPLLIMSSFTIPEDSRSTFIDRIVISSKQYILGSIASLLKPIPSPSVSSKPIQQLLEMIEQLSSKGIVSIDFVETADQTSVDISKGVKGLTFSIDSLSDTMETISCRSKQMKKYYEEMVDIVTFNYWIDIREKLSELSKLVLNVFLSLPIQIQDQNLFKFIFSYREIWEFYSLGEELSPFKLFIGFVLSWIGLVGEKLIEWSSRAITHDNFVISCQSDGTSTSLTDLMTVFSQSFSFLSQLKWKDPNIIDIAETFLSICSSCLRYYASSLIMRILAFFPMEIIIENSENGIFNSYFEEMRVCKTQPATPEQIFVIINNFLALKPSWSRFLDIVSRQLSATPLPNIEDYQNPVPFLLSVSKAIPALFAGLISNEVNDLISSRIWIENSAFKRAFCKKASPFILHEGFLVRSSDFFISVYDNTLNVLKKKVTALQGNINQFMYPKMLEAFVHGLDSGLMNLFILTKDNSPIKYKRLLPMMQFIQDIHADLFDYLQTLPNKVSPDSYSKYSWRSKMILTIMDRNPEEIIQIADSNNDILKGVCYFILLRSFTEYKRAVQWCDENGPRFMNRKFRPMLQV